MYEFQVLSIVSLIDFEAGAARRLGKGVKACDDSSLIDSTTAEKVQARRERYKKYPAGNLKARSLVAGVIYCEACNNKMSVQTCKSERGAYLFYGCQNYHVRQNKVEDTSR
jgi:hypothetical protein